MQRTPRLCRCSISNICGAGPLIRSVRRNNPMLGMQFHKKQIVGIIVFGLFVILLFLIHGPDFNTRWHNLKPGMTQTEVRQALGEPSWTGKTEVIGAGGEKVTSWQYKRGRWTYCVDFDYIGPAGAPLVYRITSSRQEWRWPSWWPWQPARAKA